ncbi:unnamed protein product [Amoebophrya sp. A120]|nr:unnamed protein product [Amoebophrya sp. A120]|eukprot:GSA120T00023013001.1
MKMMLTQNNWSAGAYSPVVVAAQSLKNSPDFHRNARESVYAASPRTTATAAKRFNYQRLMQIFETYDVPTRNGVLESEEQQADALEAGCRFVLQCQKVTEEQFHQVLSKSPLLQDILLRRRYHDGLPLAVFFELMQIVSANLEYAVRDLERQAPVDPEAGASAGASISEMRMSRTACGVVLQRAPKPHQRAQSYSTVDVTRRSMDRHYFASEYLSKSAGDHASPTTAAGRSYLHDYNNDEQLTSANVSKIEMEQQMLNVNKNLSLSLASLQQIRQSKFNIHMRGPGNSAFANEFPNMNIGSRGLGVVNSSDCHRWNPGSTSISHLNRAFTQPSRYKKIPSKVKQLLAQPLLDDNRRLSGNYWLEGVHYPAGTTGTGTLFAPPGAGGLAAAASPGSLISTSGGPQLSPTTPTARSPEGPGLTLGQQYLNLLAKNPSNHVVGGGTSSSISRGGVSSATTQQFAGSAAPGGTAIMARVAGPGGQLEYHQEHHLQQQEQSAVVQPRGPSPFGPTSSYHASPAGGPAAASSTLSYSPASGGSPMMVRHSPKQRPSSSVAGGATASASATSSSTTMMTQIGMKNPLDTAMQHVTSVDGSAMNMHATHHHHHHQSYNPQVVGGAGAVVESRTAISGQDEQLRHHHHHHHGHGDDATSVAVSGGHRQEHEHHHRHHHQHETIVSSTSTGTDAAVPVGGSSPGGGRPKRAVGLGDEDGAERTRMTHGLWTTQQQLQSSSSSSSSRSRKILTNQSPAAAGPAISTNRSATSPAPPQEFVPVQHLNPTSQLYDNAVHYAKTTMNQNKQGQNHKQNARGASQQYVGAPSEQDNSQRSEQRQPQKNRPLLYFNADGSISSTTVQSDAEIRDFRSHTQSDGINTTGGPPPHPAARPRGAHKKLKEPTPNAKGTPLLQAGSAEQDHSSDQLPDHSTSYPPVLPPLSGAATFATESCRMRNVNTETLLDSVREKLSDYVASQSGSPKASMKLREDEDPADELIPQIEADLLSAAREFDPQTQQLNARLRHLAACRDQEEQV